MKHIFFCFLLSALAHADPVVIVHSATRVTVDGADFGKPADAIANNRALAPAIQRALEAWAAAEAQKLAAAKAAHEKTIADTASVLQKIQDAKTAEEATGKGPRYQTLATGEALIKPIVIEAQKSDLEKQLDAAKAAEAAAVKARKEAEAKLSEN